MYLSWTETNNKLIPTLVWVWFLCREPLLHWKNKKQTLFLHSYSKEHLCQTFSFWSIAASWHLAQYTGGMYEKTLACVYQYFILETFQMSGAPEKKKKRVLGGHHMSLHHTIGSCFECHVSAEIKYFFFTLSKKEFWHAHQLMGHKFLFSLLPLLSVCFLQLLSTLWTQCK